MIQNNLILEDNDFIFFKDLIHQLAGINLSNEKKQLVQARLRSLIIENELSSFTEYKKFLKNQQSGSPEFQKFINHLTTNKTDFFRESDHFNYLVTKFIPEWLKTNRQTLNVWSCASSTGEEIYTLSMVFKHHLPKDRDFKILATDIDTEVLAKARNGVYPISRLSEIPLMYQNDFVTVGSGDVSKWFKIRGGIRQQISFTKHNLLEDLEIKGAPFDLIFCRNVLIYFSKETLEEVVGRLFIKSSVGGSLFIGHSESLNGINTNWKLLQPSIYIRRD